jgi:hypothetical protein
MHVLRCCRRLCGSSSSPISCLWPPCR